LFLDEDGRKLSAAPLDWGLAAMFRDLNGDSLPDLYVCNDFAYWPDRVWLNQEGQRFRAAPRHAFRCFSLSSMAVDVADINRDGHDALFVADMLSPKRESRAWQRPGMLDDVIDWPYEDPDFRPEVARNTLHLARGDGTYAEIAQYAGVAATDWTWGVAFLDVDLDGWEDLLVTTGSNHDIQDADMQARVAQYGGGRTHANRMSYLKDLPRRPTPGVAFRNQRDLTFADASAQWGFDDVGFANGLALADLDNDGDLDVVVNCLQEPARVYRNNSPAPRLAVRLRGEGKNTRGIGARITVTGGPVTQSQEMIAGGRYLSGDDAMRVFAAGEARELDIEVVWRGGRRSVVRGARANHVYEIAEEGAAPVVESPAGTLEPLFKDASAGLNHTHVDAVYDDFARQPLLPRKLSTLGPGIAWADVDGDGNDDLILGGGREGRAVVFRHRDGGGFEEWTEAGLPGENIRDQTGLLGWRGTDGVMRLVIGESNWEDADRNAPSFRVFAMGAGPNSGEAATDGDDAPSLAARDVVTGPLAMGDVDGDGRLELFVGGRAIAGRFPEAATSRLLGQDGGGFRVVQSFEGLGLVSGAVFADLNGDAAPDLALACDWGPVRLFRNEGGQLVEWNAPLRWPERAGREPRAEAIHQLTGWWNGIAAGDFDGDGRLDLVVSNWGRNWRTDQPPGMELPVHVYYGDFVGNGVVQTLVASRDPFLDRVTPWREWTAVCAAIPSVAGRVPDHHAYGGAAVETVLGDRAGVARELVANTFDSMILLNRGDHFEPRALPAEAQFAAAFGVSVADFDGDGNEDIFLAQNFFGVDAETSRQDAGTGLVLLGDGGGGFRALSPLEAGVAIYGEQRGSAVSDFDGDGRVDLAVAQQGGRTRLFRNLRARPGVRVSVRGPEGNPAGVGAVLRLRSAGRWGPARQVSLGTGYWSQDTARPVLAAPGEAETIEVRWPWGETRQYSWPAGAREIGVSSEGVGSPAGEGG
ncbi:MAG TPA: VCBS repeat-containing protein, partial [Methylomirabilota bacterium]|nr:VCBS repeat-containing protein [Methylomirabilota bacterium]